MAGAKKNFSDRKVYLMIGLPGSGKSYWSSQEVDKNINLTIVSRDAFRTMIKGKYTFDPLFEPAIEALAKLSIAELIERDFDVIIDETNLSIKRRAKWTRFVKSKFPGIQIIFVYFPKSEKNLENRMKEPRGYTKNQWDGIIKNMEVGFQEPNGEEDFDKLITINTKGREKVCKKK